MGVRVGREEVAGRVTRAGCRRVREGDGSVGSFGSEKGQGFFLKSWEGTGVSFTHSASRADLNKSEQMVRSTHFEN